MKTDFENPKKVIVYILVGLCVMFLLLLAGARNDHVKTPEEQLYDYQVKHHLPHGPKPLEDICASRDSPADCEAARRAAKCAFEPETPGCPKKSLPRWSAHKVVH